MPFLPCPVCHKTFARKDAVQCHMNSVHLELKHACSVCEKEFSTKGSLTRHINDVHEERRKYKCPQCPLRFAQLETLDKHVKRAKANYKVHGVALKCDQCGMVYDAPNHYAALLGHKCKKDDSIAHGSLCSCSVCKTKGPDEKKTQSPSSSL